MLMKYFCKRFSTLPPARKFMVQQFSIGAPPWYLCHHAVERTHHQQQQPWSPFTRAQRPFTCPVQGTCAVPCSAAPCRSAAPCCYSWTLFLGDMQIKTMNELSSFEATVEQFQEWIIWRKAQNACNRRWSSLALAYICRKVSLIPPGPWARCRCFDVQYWLQLRIGITETYVNKWKQI